MDDLLTPDILDMVEADSFASQFPNFVKWVEANSTPDQDDDESEDWPEDDSDLDVEDDELDESEDWPEDDSDLDLTD